MAKKKAATGSVVDPQYQDGRYKKSNVKTAGGKRNAVDVDDKAAKMLRGLDINAMGKVAREHGLGDRYRESWSKLNPGLCRMALGNALRGVFNPKAKKEKPVKAKKKAA